MGTGLRNSANKLSSCSQTFSQIQIKLTTLTTSIAQPTPDDVKTDEKMLVTDGPGGVANNLVYP